MGRSRRRSHIGNLVVTQAWSRATPGGAPVAGGYLSIENKGSLPDRLLSGSTDAARKTEIHEMALDNGIMTVRPVEGGLFIEAGKTLKFEPGGRHLMFIGLAAPFREGEQLSVSLAFESAGKVTVVSRTGNRRTPAGSADQSGATSARAISGGR